MARLRAVAEEARSRGFAVEAEPSVVTTMLSGCAAARDAEEASAVFEASLAAGLQPDRIVYNALSHAYAVGGEVEGAIQAREGRG